MCQSCVDRSDGCDDIAKWLRLHLTDGVGPKRFSLLLERFGTIDEVLGAGAGKLMSIPGIGGKTAERIATSRDEIDVQAELELAEKYGVDILTLNCGGYPDRLKQIADPPHVLYVKGQLIRDDYLAVAIVGSRMASRYGCEQASRLGNSLALAGFTIVSGLARGIDTDAHRGALSAGGRTIAVQGCGLGKVYPPENVELAGMIAENGAVLSELPLQYEPINNTFPARNRIIAGLSLGTIVVEAAANSGALITAGQSVDQNREVMAVPGLVGSPNSVGPHRLIKDGAKLVENYQDVLDALGAIGRDLLEHANDSVDQAHAEKQAGLFDLSQIPMTDTETTIVGNFSNEPLHIDQIVDQCSLSVSQVNATITSLQLKGLIEALPGSYYQKK